MGRPSRKRSRPASPDPAMATDEEQQAQAFLSRRRPYAGFHSLGGQQAVLARSPVGTFLSKQMTAAHVQAPQVWGAFAEADFTEASACAAGKLRVGVDVELDSKFGVAWLLNAAELPRSSRAAPSPAAGKDRLPGLHGDSTSLCNDSIQRELSHLKHAFEEIDTTVFKRVRSACNPAEDLGSGLFLNRSAMKLANIDTIIGRPVLRSVPCQRPSARRSSQAAEGSMLQDESNWRRSFGGEEEMAPCRRGQGLQLSEISGSAGVTREAGPASEPRRQDEEGTLLFADLCGGPGGFSEYILRRRRQLELPARGWGISLRKSGCSRREDAAGLGVSSNGRSRPGGEANASGGHLDPCAWRLDRLEPWCVLTVGCFSVHAAAEAGKATIPLSSEGAPATSCADVRARINGHTSNESNTARDDEQADERRGDPAPTAADEAGTSPSALEMTIDYGPHGTGDIMDEANARAFVDGVLASSGGRRLDLIVADGGFAGARDVIEQEAMLVPLLHSEALVALSLLAEGGCFVCKMFEAWTHSTALLVYIMRKMFQRIAILKPITSRPASGERYIVGTGFLAKHPEDSRWAVEHLRARLRARTGRCARAGLTGSGSDTSDSRGVPASSGTDEAIIRSTNHDGSGGSEFPSEMGLEEEMKADTQFMSYLRLVNDRLASVQADACARIVEVGTSRQGRAWAFRDSKGARSARAGVTEKNRSAANSSRSDDIDSGRTNASRVLRVETGVDRVHDEVLEERGWTKKNRDWLLRAWRVNELADTAGPAPTAAMGQLGD